jgi:Eco29kI restriction endonuclease
VSIPYNPLDKRNLADSIASALLSAPLVKISNCSGIVGAGVYAIYYSGPFASYKRLSNPSDVEPSKPIYVGKAIPKGGRKGGLMLDSSKGRSLSERLSQHAESIRQSENLDVNDFDVRYLVVEDIWIPLGENVLIDTFSPLWNTVLDGFGNKDPGAGRVGQRASPWDILHPGRAFSKKLAVSNIELSEIQQRVENHVSK